MQTLLTTRFCCCSWMTLCATLVLLLTTALLQATILRNRLNCGLHLMSLRIIT
ncbi:hypothetical protein SPFM1_00149 [Salmonella phage SPFM1]|nr:hypothetical protein SPFM1_00149 [Salmonella phage SPFM1]